MGTVPERPPLGLVALLALGLNGIIGVGIFFVPRDVAGLVPGLTGVAVYVLTALALLPVAAVYAVLGWRFSEDGGPYVWARAAFGAEVAFVVGWVAWLSAVLSTAAVVLGLAETAASTWGGGGMAGTFAVIFLVGFSAVAALGLRPSAAVWTVVTVAKLVPLGALVLLGVARLGVTSAPPAGAPAGLDFVRAMLVVVFALQGFEVVALPAGQSRPGAASVPIATLGSLGGAAVVYALVHAVAVLAVPNLPSVEGPLQCAGERLGGASFGTLIGLGAGISAGGIAFGTVVMTPRYLAALGRQDGLGTWIAQQGVARVPRRALAVTASLAGLLVFLALGTGLADGLRALFVLSSIMVLLQYAVSAAALVALSARRRAGLRPRDLWPAPLAFATIFAIGAAATTDELLVGAAAIGLGALVPLARRLGVTPGAAPRG